VCTAGGWSRGACVVRFGPSPRPRRDCWSCRHG
jgi:hypothetical protein